MESRLDSIDLTALPADDARFMEQLERVAAFSDYALDLLRRHPDWLCEDWDGSSLAAPQEPQRQRKQLDACLDPDDEAGLMRTLRLHRHRNLLRILWRDVNGDDELDRVMAQTTDLAEVLIDTAFRHAEARLLERHGAPRNGQGGRQRAVVLGMGKLGGRELNFSSDIDLIIAFPEAGETDGARALSNEEFFARQTRLAVKWLNERSENGFVYRVDLRLRPFGDAGRLALSFDAMEQYYQREGRDWERYAWIKARPVSDASARGDELLERLRPFVYRRYLDYPAFEALREMKAMIRAEVQRRDLGDDIKLGSGGIREVEFIAQAFQLIRGGREPSLRGRSLRPTLETLVELGLLEPETRRALDGAYVLLRRVENRLQQVSDAQTHALPREQEARDRLAASLGLPDWSVLSTALDQARQKVRATFASVFEQQGGAASDSDNDGRWHRAWDRAAEPGELAALLQRAGFGQAEEHAALLSEFRGSAVYRSLGERARARLGQFMPRLLASIAAAKDPDQALPAVMKVIRAIASRSAYVSLLHEQPPVLERLIDLCAASSWLTETVAQHPLLLDDLIDVRLSVAERSLDDLRATVRQRVRAVEEGDLEAEMNALRRVQQGQAMGIAAGALDGRLAPREVARALTVLAEAILDEVFRLAWRDMAERHGLPEDTPRIAVVGYGTLGGRELNFGSDLDLVFLHRGRSGGGADTESFAMRVTRRILHLLSTLTATGRLYEVDVRLRPNGRSGFLVSSVEAFDDYQRSKAWTWELQALTRARVVAGSRELVEDFEAVRHAALCRERDPGELTAAVLDMRRRMREELDRGDEESFDLKQGVGGKVDVEFLVQWLRLNHAASCPELVRETGTAEGLEQAAELKLLSPGAAETLLEAYEHYRALGQRQALAEAPERVLRDEVGVHPGRVRDLWEALLEQGG